MKLRFYGADKEVTGSCHQLEVRGKKILIDCGLQQGGDELDNNALPFSAGEVDCVLVTHAHIDHSGRLPLLVKNGYKGPIIATRLTCNLLKIMLMDSARIQENDAQWKTQKGARAGDDPVEPLYTVEDAQAALDLLQPCEYGQELALFDGIQAVFVDAGHLLGSASILLTMREAGITRTIAFSGDIGNTDQPIIKDPHYLTKADYVVMESTYGNRMHEGDGYTVEELAQVIDETLRKGGNVIIPSFAVGRTQELLYYIREMKARKLVRFNPDFPVYVDSPLALEATEVYSGDLRGYADEETIQVLKSGFQPIRFSNLRLCRTADESKLLNADEEPKVIISSSGMCEAGRIRHHLKHNLWRPECTILFVGYQANGTLGRLLVDGVDTVKLFGERISVRARIVNFRGMSGHADKAGLLKWINSFAPEKPRKVFVVHGEEDAALTFAETIRLEGYTPLVPDFKAVYDLAEDRLVDAGVPAASLHIRVSVQRKVSPAYLRLQLMGQKLLEAIRHNEGGANKDLAKFADQLQALIDKWDR
jgi:metallo-beta-lactamase family protein